MGDVINNSPCYSDLLRNFFLEPVCFTSSLFVSRCNIALTEYWSVEYPRARVSCQTEQVSRGFLKLYQSSWGRLSILSRPLNQGKLCPRLLYDLHVDPFCRALADCDGRCASALAGITDSREATRLPGISFGVSFRGRTVLAAGIGHRSVGKGDDQALPMDENTLVNVGSISKGFTVAAVGILVEEGKLQ